MFLLTGVFWGRIVRVLLTCVETSQSPGFEVGPVTPYFGFQHGDWLILKNTDRTIVQSDLFLRTTRGALRGS